MKAFYRLSIIVLLLFLAFFFQEMPTSFLLQKMLPEWPFIVCLLLLIVDDEYFTLPAVFCIGVLQDVFSNTPLGLNALLYIVLGYGFMIVFQRFKTVTLLMQASIVAFLVTIKLIILSVYTIFAVGFPMHYWEVLSIFLSFFVWLFLHYLFSSLLYELYRKR